MTFLSKETNSFCFNEFLINCYYKKDILYRSKKQSRGLFRQRETPSHSKVAIISFAIGKFCPPLAANSILFSILEGPSVIIFGLILIIAYIRS